MSFEYISTSSTKNDGHFEVVWRLSGTEIAHISNFFNVHNKHDEGLLVKIRWLAKVKVHVNDILLLSRFKQAESLEECVFFVENELKGIFANVPNFDTMLAPTNTLLTEERTKQLKKQLTRKFEVGCG